MVAYLKFIIVFSRHGTHLYNEDPVYDKMPRWLYAMAAIGYFLYRLLDEMDGKQARRTGNSSPLGMLFDHGIDAYTTGIVCLLFCKLSQIGTLGYIFVELSCAIFYFCTLQEYYQGGLFLPFGNAITD